MIVFRLSKSKYKNDIAGLGAKLSGGRWNNVGVACIYTSDSRALAVLEYAANIELDLIPRALHITLMKFRKVCLSLFRKKISLETGR